jgi:Acetyl-CoA carboxylase, carboxyltransferase component (subunits alpha and beta)
MPSLASSLSPNSSEFRANREAMLALISGFRSLEEKVRQNSARKEAQFRKRGQLLPRERLSALLDPGRDFLELSSLAGLSLHDDDGDAEAAGGNAIVGLGWVSERLCVVNVSDSGIKGGAMSPMGLRKTLRAQEIALREQLPVITLLESGGANLLYQSELFVEGGRVFANMARLSAAGLPQITVVHGPSTAGGAYIPGLSDYVISVEGRASMYLAGPPLVKAAIEEVVEEEFLGGARMHAEVTGSSEYLAADDAEAIAIARD